jgi:hypothetical protein
MGVGVIPGGIWVIILVKGSIYEVGGRLLMERQKRGKGGRG